jgi:hypothetical protein
MPDEQSYPCPLVERVIWDAECYDVQMVHYGLINPAILDFAFDKSKADQVCESCPFNQLKQPVYPAGKIITA